MSLSKKKIPFNMRVYLTLFKYYSSRWSLILYLIERTRGSSSICFRLLHLLLVLQTYGAIVSLHLSLIHYSILHYFVSPLALIAIGKRLVLLIFNRTQKINTHVRLPILFISSYHIIHLLPIILFLCMSISLKVLINIFLNMFVDTLREIEIERCMIDVISK